MLEQLCLTEKEGQQRGCPVAVEQLYGIKWYQGESLKETKI
jgi:hypothetical protein